MPELRTFSQMLGLFSEADNEDPGFIESPPVAIIETVDPESFNDPGTNFFERTDDPQNQIVWTDFKAFNRLEKDRHIYVGGLSSPDGQDGQTVAFVSLTNPTLIWVCEWTSSGFGNIPRIPDPESVGDNWVLLDDHYEAATVRHAPDKRKAFYRASGTYYYGCVSPDVVTVLNLKFPRPMWISAEGVLQIGDTSPLTDGLISDDTGPTITGD